MISKKTGKSCFDSKDISEYKIEDWSGKGCKECGMGKSGEKTGYKKPFRYIYR